MPNGRLIFFVAEHPTQISTSILVAANRATGGDDVVHLEQGDVGEVR